MTYGAEYSSYVTYTRLFAFLIQVVTLATGSLDIGLMKKLDMSLF